MEFSTFKTQDYQTKEDRFKTKKQTDSSSSVKKLFLVETSNSNITSVYNNTTCHSKDARFVSQSEKENSCDGILAKKLKHTKESRPCEASTGPSDSAQLKSSWKDLAKHVLSPESNLSVLLNSSQLKSIDKSLYNTADTLSCQDLVNIATAFLKLECKDLGFLYSIQEAIKVLLTNPKFFNAQELINISTVFATLDCKDESLIATLKESVKEYLKNPEVFSANDLANILWFFAKFGCKDINLIYSLQRLIRPFLENNPQIFNSHELAKMAWAFAKIEVENDSLITALKRAIEPKLQNDSLLDFQDLIDIIWSFANFDCKDENFIEALKKSIKNHPKNCYLPDVQKATAINFRLNIANGTNPIEVHQKVVLTDEFRLLGQNLTKLFWSFAKLGCKDDDFIYDICDSINVYLKSDYFFDVKDLGCIAWAHAKLNCKNDLFLKSLKRSIKKCLQNPDLFNAKDLSRIVWAFAWFGTKDIDFMNELKTLIEPHIQKSYSAHQYILRGQNVQGDQNYQYLDVKEFVNIAWAFGKYKFDSTCNYFLIDLLKSYVIYLTYFNLHELANIAWAYTNLGCKDDVNSLRRSIEYQLRNDSSFDIYDLSNIIFAFAEFGCTDESFINTLKTTLENKQKNGPDVLDCEEKAILEMAFEKLELRAIDPTQFEVRHDKFESTASVSTTILSLLQCVNREEVIGKQFVDSSQSSPSEPSESVSLHFESLDGLSFSPLQLSAGISAVSESKTMNISELNTKLASLKFASREFFQILEDYFDVFDYENVSLFWQNLGIRDDIRSNWQDCYATDKCIFGVKSHTLKMLDKFNNQQLASVIFGFSKLPCNASDSINFFKTVVTDRLKAPSSFKCFELVKILEALASFAEFGCKDDAFINSIMEVIKVELRKKINGKKEGSFDAKDIASITLALEKLNYTNVVIIDLLERNIKMQLNCQKQTGNIFTSSELYNIATAFAQFNGINHSSKQLLEEVVWSKLQDPNFFSYQELCGFIEIFTKLGKDKRDMRKYESLKEKFFAIKPDTSNGEIAKLQVDSNSSKAKIRKISGKVNLKAITLIQSRKRPVPKKQELQKQELQKIEEIEEEIATFDTAIKTVRKVRFYSLPQTHRNANSKLSNLSQTYGKLAILRSQKNGDGGENSLSIINTILTKKLTQEEFFDNMRMHLHLFTNANFVTFWKILAKYNEKDNWGVSFNDPRLSEIRDFTIEILNDLKPQKIVDLTLAFTKHGKSAHSFIDSLKRVIRSKLVNFEFFSVQQIVNIINAFAEVGCKDEYFVKVLKILIEPYLQNEYSLSAQNIADITLAFAKLDCKDELFIYNLKSLIDMHLEEPSVFNAQNLSSIILGFAEFGCEDSNFNVFLMKLIECDLNNPYFSNLHNLANVIWAVARLRCVDVQFINVVRKKTEPFIQKFYDLLVKAPDELNKPCEQTSYQFNVEDFVNLAYAFAAFNCDDDELKHNLMKLIEPYILKLHRFKPSQLANITLAFSRFNCENVEIVRTLYRLIAEQMQENPSFNIYELATILMAFSRFEYRDNNLINNIKIAIEEQQKAGPYLFNPQELSVLKLVFSALENGVIAASPFINRVSSAESSREVVAFSPKMALKTTAENGNVQKVSSHLESKDDKFENRSDEPESTPTTLSAFESRLLPMELQFVDFFNIVDKHYHSLEVDDVAVIWNHIGNYKYRMFSGGENKKLLWENIWFDNRRLNAIKDLTYNRLDRFNDVQLVDIAWAVSKLHCKDAALINRLKIMIEERLRKSSSLDEYALVKVVHAFVNFKCSDDNFIRLLTKTIKTKLHNHMFYNIHNIVSITWQLTLFNFGDTALIQKLNKKIEERLKLYNVLSVEELCCIVRAVEKYHDDGKLVWPPERQKDDFILVLEKAVGARLKEGANFDERQLRHFFRVFNKFKASQEFLQDIDKARMSKIIHEERAVNLRLASREEIPNSRGQAKESSLTKVKPTKRRQPENGSATDKDVAGVVSAFTKLRFTEDAW